MVFLYHLEVAYDIYFCRWGNQGYAVEHILGKECVGHLDNAFGAELL